MEGGISGINGGSINGSDINGGGLVSTARGFVRFGAALGLTTFPNIIVTPAQAMLFVILLMIFLFIFDWTFISSILVAGLLQFVITFATVYTLADRILPKADN